MSLFPKDSTQKHAAMSGAGLAPLVADLYCESKIICSNARRALVEKGQESIPPLVDALKNGKEAVPLEAAKALGKIGGPRAIQALIGALEDDRFEVRWTAAEALIELEPGSIKPLLKAVMNNSTSLLLREGVHHVLKDTPDVEKSELLSPVVKALEDTVPELGVVVAAKRALDLMG